MMRSGNAKRLDFAFVGIVILALVAGGVAWRVYLKTYRPADTVDIHRFPRVMGGWTAEDVLITDEEKAILETDNVFVRRYTNEGGEEVYLFIVYSQSNRKVSHPPEICYTGGGAAILNSVHESFRSNPSGKIVKVNQLTVEKGLVTQIFIYWFKVGDSFTSNYWEQQGLIALKSLFGKSSSSALIRISTTVQGEDEAGASMRVKEFGGLILPFLYQYLP